MNKSYFASCPLCDGEVEASALKSKTREERSRVGCPECDIWIQIKLPLTDERVFSIWSEWREQASEEFK